MSVLKAETIVPQGSTVTLQMYPKADVDKVIAELKENHKTEVKELLCLIRDKDNNFNRAFDSEEKEIRRLQHALWLLRFAFAKLKQDYIGRFEYNESNLDEMWEKRADYWKAKADKFKEAK